LERSEHLARAVGAIARLPAGVAPSRDMLAELRHGWNNDIWSADFGYLEDVADRAAAASGPILECGSGVTTLLLSALAAKRGVEVWALEHSPDWYLYIYAALAQLELPPVHVCFCPLRNYGEFSWYTLPRSTLPRDFELVLCDGPPGDTPGGRFGLWPILGSHLAPGAAIVLDDTNRKHEQAILGRWLTSSRGKAITYSSHATLLLPP